MADPAAPDPASEEERGVEGEEDRFYTRSDPRGAAALPPAPGTTPAELEESGDAALVPEDAAGRPRTRRA